MAAVQSRALAAAGQLVLRPDLLGCGDSDGDFGDATWSDWVDDVVAACHWLRTESCADSDVGGLPLTLWGQRAGALIAVAAAARLGDVPRLLLWQPAAQGKTLLQQFLRLQMAGAMVARATVDDAEASRLAPRGSGRGRTAFAAGETVEIAGYRVGASLAAGLEGARLEPVAGVRQLHWLELSKRDEVALSPASQAALTAWRVAGCEVHARVVTGPAFWQTTDIEEAPELVDASTQAVLAQMSRVQPP